MKMILMVEIGRLFWKKVVTSDDYVIGETESAELDTVTWQIKSFYVSLNDDASTKMGFDRPYFGKVFICLPVSSGQGTWRLRHSQQDVR